MVPAVQQVPPGKHKKQETMAGFLSGGGGCSILKVRDQSMEKADSIAKPTFRVLLKKLQRSFIQWV